MVIATSTITLQEQLERDIIKVLEVLGVRADVEIAKGMKNYIMPFTAEELNCAKNDLNVLFPEKYMKLDIFYNNDELEQPFDFREFFHSFHYSDEAKALYDAALKIFLYYHNSKEYSNKDYNDSFYDITNAIMGKDINLRGAKRNVEERG